MRVRGMSRSHRVSGTSMRSIQNPQHTRTRTHTSAQVWYDVQALSLALHLGNRSGARFLSRDALRRVAAQIQPNGTMPRELARSRAMHYTYWNLQALFELATLAGHGGVDV